MGFESNSIVVSAKTTDRVQSPIKMRNKNEIK